MQKVLHPSYFPYFQIGDNYCNEQYPLYWKAFTLEQAMAAYWKVKSWSFSISGYSNGGSGSVQVNVNADKMSDLVCPTQSSGSGSGSDEVFNITASVSSFGFDMIVDCFDDIEFYYSSYGATGGYNNSVLITIGDYTIFDIGTWNSPASANIQITATSFFEI
jgi:hypothetical protein